MARAASLHQLDVPYIVLFGLQAGAVPRKTYGWRTTDERVTDKLRWSNELTPVCAHERMLWKEREGAGQRTHYSTHNVKGGLKRGGP